jgi:hypothetical protein
MNFGISSYAVPSGGGAATLPGAGANKYSPAYGGVPQVPNPAATQGQSIEGNAANLPQLIALLSGLDTSQQSQLLNNYGMAIPNYSGLTSTASTDVGNNLHGHLSDDVIAQLTQQAAERGITTGSPGSPNANAAYLRALGLTSLNLENTGLQQLATMTQTAPVAPLVNPASFLVTPEQQQEAQMASNTYAAAPDPGAAASKAISLASAAEPAPTGPWWANAAGMPLALGPGSYFSNGVWHTPAR